MEKKIMASLILILLSTCVFSNIENNTNEESKMIKTSDVLEFSSKIISTAENTIHKEVINSVHSVTEVVK